MLALTLALLFAFPQPVKMAVLPLVAGPGVDEKTTEAVSEALLSEVRKAVNSRIVVPSDIQTLIPSQKVLGCTEDSACYSPLSEALGVDHILVGELSKVGASWLIHLKRVDVHKSGKVTQASQRLKNQPIDGVLDALPRLVQNIFKASEGPPPQNSNFIGSAVPKDPLVGQQSSKVVEESFDLGSLRQKLLLFSDGKDHLLALKPYKKHPELFLLAGDSRALYLQRTTGGGSTLATGEFEIDFWEPRALDQSSFQRVGASYRLECGNQKVNFRPVSTEESKSILGQVKILQPRWQRHPLHLARDSAGNYYYVDAPWIPVKGHSILAGLHFYFGSPGKMAAQKTIKTLQDSEGTLVITPSGQLKVSENQAIWVSRKSVFPLVSLDIYQNEGLIYNEFGIYEKALFGTACEPYF